MDPLTLRDRPPVVDPTVLVAFSGWSDAGAAATTAVQYVAERTGARPFASLDCEDFFDFTVQRPLVHLDPQELRQIRWPSYEFLASESHNLVFLVGPEPHLRWRTFCSHVVRALRKAEVRTAVLLGAFLAEVLYSDPVALTGFASDPAVLDRLRVQPTSYQGPTGIVGVLADALRRESFPIVSLWAAIPHYIAATPNPRGALALLLKLKEWTDLPIEMTPLESAATAFQAQLLEAVERNENLSSYIRGLKKGETSH